jgi:hypothetical protein
LAVTFGRSRASVCLIVNSVGQHIADIFNLKCFCDLSIWSPRATQYTAAISQRMPFISYISAFIDGTGRAICRPVRDQQRVFNGYHRDHELKYQSVLTPDGLIVSMAGPFDGRHHDPFMLAESQFNEIMDADPVLQHMCVFADTCMDNGNQVSDMFGVLPPSIDEYLASR